VAQIYGRPKHIYSIFRKMERKGVGFEQIYDVHGFRIIVENVGAVLRGAGRRAHDVAPDPRRVRRLHRQPQRQHVPQPAHRRAHQARRAPGGDPDSHAGDARTAELGIAAHWQYKEQARHSKDVQKKIAYLRKLMSGAAGRRATPTNSSTA
jgi:hypothetical protein